MWVCGGTGHTQKGGGGHQEGTSSAPSPPDTARTTPHPPSTWHHGQLSPAPAAMPSRSPRESSLIDLMNVPDEPDEFGLTRSVQGSPPQQNLLTTWTRMETNTSRPLWSRILGDSSMHIMNSGSPSVGCAPGIGRSFGHNIVAAIGSPGVPVTFAYTVAVAALELRKLLLRCHRAEPALRFLKVLHPQKTGDL